MSAADTSSALPLVLLALLVAFTYGGLLDHSFLDCWDDPEYVTMNQAVRGFSWQNLKLAWTTTYAGNYVPVQIISYMLDYALWGMAPAGFLGANICYHYICGAILYRLLNRLGSGKGGALLGSALFLVHPVQMESVAWVSQRKNLLAMLFFLMALTAYVKYREQPPETAWKWYLPSFTCYLLSLLSKPVAVIFPLVIILFDALHTPPRKKSTAVIDKIPFLLAAAIIGAATTLIQSSEWTGGREPYPYEAIIVLPLTMLTVLNRYLQLLIWPAPSNLSILYQVRNRHDLDPAVLAALATFIGLIVLGVYWYRKDRTALFWYALFFVGLLPVSQIIPIVTKMNDRYLYFPMIGIAGLMGHAVRTWGDRLKSRNVLRSGISVSVAMVVLLSLACRARGQVWKNTITLFSDAVSKSPGIVQSWVGLANGYEAAGDFEQALRYYEKGSEYGSLGMKDSFKLATYYLERGEFDKANRHYLFLRLKALKPGKNKEGLLLMGEYQGMIGNYGEAEKLVLEYLSHDPNSARALETMARICSLNHDTERAAHFLERANRLNSVQSP